MTNNEVTQQKTNLRRMMRARINALSTESVKYQAEQLNIRLKQAILQEPLKVIASFAALPVEPTLEELHKSLPNHLFVYPKVTGVNSIDFHYVDSLDNLNTGAYGILEPTGKEPICPVTEIDLILCPAYAYDRRGNRLGKGGGFYDRILTKMSRDTKIWGVIFKEQLLSEIPTLAHDIAVQRVFTPV